MGRKLSSWEKAQRDREREREREANRQKTAARRAKERKAKQEVESAQRDLGSLYSKVSNMILYGLTNYVGFLLQEKMKFPSARNIAFPSPFDWKYPGDLKAEEYQSGLNINSFKPNSALKTLKFNKDMDYNFFKGKYGSFFANIFGQTKKNHAQFISEASVKYDEIYKKDQKRKEDYKIAFKEYEQEILAYNQDIIKKGVTDNSTRKSNFESLSDQLNIFNNELSTFQDKVDQTFNSINNPSFNKLFCNNLPLEFDHIDEMAKELMKGIPELSKDFYISPKSHFKYGFGLTSNTVHLFLLYDDQYFPLPSRQQVNSVASGWSVRPLIKKSIQSLEKDMTPSAAIYYCHYAFKSISAIDKLFITVGKEGIDRATGSKNLEWLNNYLIERDKFEGLNFEHVESNQALDLFSFKEKLQFDSEAIYWSSSRSSSNNVFSDDLKVLHKSNEELESKITSFESEKFQPPKKPKSLVDKEALVKRIGGIK